MILRRITQHVKEQNWFAVVLDFFIVVAGILIAFQVTNWNEQRQSKAALVTAENSLQTDLFNNYFYAQERISLSECRVGQLKELSEKLMEPGEAWQGLARDDPETVNKLAIKSVLRSPSRVWGSRVWKAELNLGTVKLMNADRREAFDVLFKQTDDVERLENKINSLQARLKVLSQDMQLPRIARLRYFDTVSEIDQLGYYIELIAGQIIQSIERIGLVIDDDTAQAFRESNVQMQKQRTEVYGSCTKPIPLGFLNLERSEANDAVLKTDEIKP